MSVQFYARGHLCFLEPGFPPVATYADGGGFLEWATRACVRCGLPPTPEGFDACLGLVDGVSSACCGHGVEDPYMATLEGEELRGVAAVAYFTLHAPSARLHLLERAAE